MKAPAASTSARLLGAALLLGAGTWSADAGAAGMYISDRGVRPMGRGGAFVAGADDLGAIAYNPAGLADAKTALLLDASYVGISTNFTRRAVVADSAGNPITVTYPTAKGTTPFIPIPTIAGSYSPSFQNNMFTFAGGVYAPYAALSKFPETVDGQPAGSRYSLISLEGSALVVVGAYVAFKPIEQLRIGVGFEALVGELATTQIFNASPRDRLLSSPESPEFDAKAKLKTKPFFAPRGTFGITGVPIPELRLGVAFQMPFRVDTPADLEVNLPQATLFDNAYQEGTGVNVKTVLPAVFRAGVEIRPVDVLRVEAAYVHELWGSSKELALTPTDMQFYGITGFPSPFPVPPVSVPQNYKGSHSFRLGGEFSAIKDIKPVGLDLRAGINYETSAVPNDYLTPLVADLSRLTLAIGVGVRPHRAWRLDALYARIIGFKEDVDPATAGVSAVNPVRGNPSVVAPINAGTYEVSGNIIGLGATVQLQ